MNERLDSIREFEASIESVRKHKQSKNFAIYGERILELVNNEDYREARRCMGILLVIRSQTPLNKEVSRDVHSYILAADKMFDNLPREESRPYEPWRDSFRD